ncbi:helix-turn-helix domain-containing protein [Priestia megaterium]
MNQAKEVSNKDKRPERLTGKDNVFGNRLNDLKEEYDYSFETIGNILKKSKQTIIGYRHGYRFPLMRDIEKLAKLFDTSVSYLLGETDIRIPSPLEKMIENGNFTYNGRVLTEEELYRVLEHLQKKNKEESVEENAENNSKERA